MPLWLQEREVFAALLGSIIGTVLMVIGEITTRPALADNGTWILSSSLLSIGISRGLAKVNEVRGGPR